MTDLQKLLLKSSIDFLKTQETPAGFEEIKTYIQSNCDLNEVVGRLAENTNDPRWVWELRQTLGRAARTGLILRDRALRTHLLTVEGRALSTRPFIEVMSFITERAAEQNRLRKELLHRTFSILNENPNGLSKQSIFEQLSNHCHIPQWLNTDPITRGPKIWHEELSHSMIKAKCTNFLNRTDDLWSLTAAGETLLKLSPEELHKTILRTHFTSVELNQNAIEALCSLAEREQWCSDEFCTTCGGGMYRSAFVEIAQGKHPNSSDWLISKRRDWRQVNLPGYFNFEQLIAFINILKNVNMARWGESNSIRFALSFCRHSFEVRNIISEEQIRRGRRGR